MCPEVCVVPFFTPCIILQPKATNTVRCLRIITLACCHNFPKTMNWDIELLQINESDIYFRWRSTNGRSFLLSDKLKRNTFSGRISVTWKYDPFRAQFAMQETFRTMLWWKGKLNVERDNYKHSVPAKLEITKRLD